MENSESLFCCLLPFCKAEWSRTGAKSRPGIKESSFGKEDSMEKTFTVDLIVPAYKPGRELDLLLEKIQEQTHKVRKIILVNTEKAYLDENRYKDIKNLQIHHIKKSEFDHGRTRDFGAKLSDADILVFMTQDAVPKNERLIENLLGPFENPEIGAAYARQLPADDCREVEKFTRAFNYPAQSSVKSLKDLDRLGIKTFFCSNVCAAYRRDLYESLGGFVKKTIFNEDMIFAGNIIKSGKSIAYAADAEVVHSHNYGNMEQLRRNFDLAVSQEDHPEVFAGVKSESEGIRLVKKSAAHLVRIGKPWLIPDLIIKSGFKFIGYKLGRKYRSLPQWLINRLTMNLAYWL